MQTFCESLLSLIMKRIHRLLDDTSHFKELKSALMPPRSLLSFSRLRVVNPLSCFPCGRVFRLSLVFCLCTFQSISAAPLRSVVQTPKTTGRHEAWPWPAPKGSVSSLTFITWLKSTFFRSHHMVIY